MGTKPIAPVLFRDHERLLRLSQTCLPIALQHRRPRTVATRRRRRSKTVLHRTNNHTSPSKAASQTPILTIMFSAVLSRHSGLSTDSVRIHRIDGRGLWLCTTCRELGMMFHLKNRKDKLCYHYHSFSFEAPQSVLSLFYSILRSHGATISSFITAIVYVSSL